MGDMQIRNIFAVNGNYHSYCCNICIFHLDTSYQANLIILANKAIIPFFFINLQFILELNCFLYMFSIALF